MQRLTPLNSSNRESPLGDSEMSRSSTEVHEDLTPRDMSVADHSTSDPDCGSETSEDRKSMTPDNCIKKYINPHTSQLFSWNKVTSPGRMITKAYTATPYSKPVTPVIETEPEFTTLTKHEDTEPINVHTPTFTPIKVPGYSIPKPYNRRSMSYTPVKWQSPMSESEQKDNPIVELKQKEDDTIPECGLKIKNEIAECERKGDDAEAECVQKSVDANTDSEQNDDDADVKCEQKGRNAKVDRELKGDDNKAECGQKLVDVKTEREPREANDDVKYELKASDYTVTEGKQKIDDGNTESRAKGDDDQAENEKKDETVIVEFENGATSIADYEGRNIGEIKAELEKANEEEQPVSSRLSERTIASSFSPLLDLKQSIPDSLQESTNGENVCGIQLAHTESKSTVQKEFASELALAIDNELKLKETRRKDILLTMAPIQETENAEHSGRVSAESNKKNSKAPNSGRQSKQKKAKKSAVKEKPPANCSAEMQKLKRAFDEHLREREHLDKMIDQREQDIDEQLRELDEILESVKSENSEVEQAAGEFADTMKKYTNFRDEATRTRVCNKEQELSAEILFEENAEWKEQIHELVIEVNEIKERRATGFEELLNDSEEMQIAIEMLREKNEELEVEIRVKVDEFNDLRMSGLDNSISYMTDRIPVQVSDNESEIPELNITLSPELNTTSPDDLRLDITGVENNLPVITTPRIQDRNKYYEEQFENACKGGIFACPTSSSQTEVLSDKESNSNTETERNGAQSVDYSTNKVQPVESLNFEQKRKTKDFINENKRTQSECEVVETKQNMSATELRTTPDSQRRKSRIPKPILPYGSSSRERLGQSQSSSFTSIETESFKAERKINLVQENPRCETKLRMQDLRAQGELFRLDERRGDVDVQEIWYNDRNGCENSDTHFLKVNGEERPSQEKPKSARKKKKEIKSKIDTGLRNRPNNTAVRKKETCEHSVTKGDASFSKHEKSTNDIKRQTAKKKKCVKSKEIELRPLKNTPKTTKDASDMPKLSKSFGEKNPLPKIKQTSSAMKTKCVKAKELALPPLKNTPRTTKEASDLPKSSRSFGDKAPLPKIKQAWTGKKKKCVKSKEFELPPIKNTPKSSKDAGNMPRSSRSFGEMHPLPNTQQIHRQGTMNRSQVSQTNRKTTNGNGSFQKTCQKRDTGSRSSRFSDPLPPISKADDKKPDLSLTVNGTAQNAKKRKRRLPPIISSQDQQEKVSNHTQRPEALLVSFSTSTPSGNERKQTEREQSSPAEGDQTRITFGRA